MNTKIKLLLGVFVVIGVLVSYCIPDLYAAEPLVIKHSIPKIAEKEKPTNIPPPYCSMGKLDPFKTLAQYQEEERAAAETQKIEPVKPVVPDTALTRYLLSMINLDGILIRADVPLAIFTTPKPGELLKGFVGDYIGKGGQTIKSITHDGVVLSDGEVIKSK